MDEYLQANLRAQLIDRRQRLSTAVERQPGTEHLVNLLQQVDSALERMDLGAYGVCEECHEAIEADRRGPLRERQFRPLL